jgi:Mg2+-importing ATPase
MITGDQASVALQIAQSVGLARGLQASSILCGHHIDLLDDAALCQRAAITPIFAQTEPHHKARIIRALRHSGQIVGYLGDGLNDVPALQAAHVAVSVHNAAQVARQSADVVLTKNDLRVLSRGIDEGRRTFANTRKYLTVTTSANLGNMLSMAIGSILLPFFPMSSGQILLNNLLSDVPALFLSVDRVPSEIIQKSQRWQLTDFVRTILAFGLISSGFDAALFGLLSFTWGVSEAEFQTAWFQFSLLTELITIILLCRSKTRWENLPSAPIVLSCVIVGLLALMMPVCSFTQMTLSFESLRWPYLICVLLLSLAYGVCIESAKTMLHRYSGNNE